MKLQKEKPKKIPAAEVGETTKVLPRRSRFPLWKKLLFAGVACALSFAVIELVLAVVGVEPILFERDPYLGFSSRIPLFVEDRAQSEQGIMVTAENKRRFFNVQRFAAKKPKGAYRIFCLGGSTTYGHPYADSTSFAGWLRAMLPKADPSRRWEVINGGGISYATYREALLMEELIQYEPDLFIVLTGHNEFLEQRTYAQIIAIPRALRGVGAWLSKTRLYAVTKGALDTAAGKSPAASHPSNVLSGEVQAILDRTVGAQAYHRDEAWRQNVIDHYRFNLARMVDIARSVAAQVILVTPASNLRHCSPFKSEHRPGMQPQEIEQWQTVVQQAVQHQRNLQWAESLAALDQAAQLDDRYAELHYWRGQSLWELKQFNEARAAFIRALDEDVCPLRALRPIVDITKEIATERRVPVVDFVKMMEEKATNGIAGADWFLDHVHPTIEGNRQLALALLETMARLEVLRPAATWNDDIRREIQRAVESALTPRDHATALSTLAKVIAWAGKTEEAYRLALSAVQLAPDDAAAQFEAGKNAARLERKEEAAGYLKAALALNPNFVEAKSLLGTVLAGTSQSDEAGCSTLAKPFGCARTIRSCT